MYFRNNTLQWKSKKKNQNITFGQIKILFLKISHLSGSPSLECQENDPLSIWVLVERNLRELLAPCSLLAFALSVDFTQPFSRLLLHSDWTFSAHTTVCFRLQLLLCAQSCPTLCDHVNCSPPGSSVHEIFQARTLEWVAISYSRGSSQTKA